jgi:hypothetical protein
MQPTTGSVSLETAAVSPPAFVACTMKRQAEARCPPGLGW